MELMEIFKSRAFAQWITESLVWFFLLGGIVVSAVGLGLFFRTDGTLRLFDTMNRWVSMRRPTRPLDIARDTRSLVQRYRLGLAVLFVAGAVFALYGLVAQFNAAAVIYIYRLDIFKPAFASWVVESVRWILVVGNIIAIVIGLALALFPGWVETLEARGSRWFSGRQATKDANELRLQLDRRVAAHPRVSGILMMLFGLVLVVSFGLRLLGR